MKKYFEKTSIALIIAMMFILAIFGGAAMKTHTNADNVKYKTAVNAQDVKTGNGTRTTTQVELGQYISLGKYNGKDVIWRCVSVDDKGSLMLADKVIDTLPYDAKTNDNNRSKSHSRNYNRDTYGSNYWKDSNMRSWLNSTAVAGEVKWLCGNPPREDSVNGNAYDQKAGFLNDFSKAEIAAMKNVTQRSIVSHPEYNLGFHDGEGRSDLEFNRDIENVANNFNSAYGENSTEKVFLLDVKQVNTVWKNFGNYYIARNEQGVAWPYWLRTPYSSCNHLMRYVEASGSIERHYPMTDYMGVRPAFYLDSDYYVTTSGDGSASNPYVGSAPDKVEDDYTVAEPEEDPNQEWDISLDQSLNLTLGPWYSSDGKYANPTIPVYTIQKTRSDTENMVILFCGEGYTKSQQQKFINDVKKVWESAMQHEPYRSYADRFNVYALCTASESSFNSGDSTFFDVVIDKSSGPMIGLSKSISKNHIFERCIGPAFLEKIHDAHIPKKTDPNSSYWVGNNSPLSEYEPFYYVHKYINQFAVLVNTTQDFGGSHRNYERGIHYLVTPADSARAQKTFTHELGHGLLELGDEYMSSTTQQTDLTSLNVAHTHDPNNVKWKQLLGFRKTYTCNALGYGNAYNSSYECLMRDTTYGFCEVCKLQGSKRMSQLIDGKSLYVADPEVKKYTGQYSQPSDFEDTTYNGYANFAYYRSGVLLSGADKNKFNTGMAGEKIQLRTIVQNLSDTTQRNVTMKMWIKRADGSVATARSEDKLETSQTFTIPVWSEKSKFWPKGALSYEGSNMNSGLENCELIYQIPADALLNPGDTVAFEVTDEKGNVLANDNTETQTYANINIEYKFEDGTPMPNANKATIPVAVGSKLNWTAPAQLYGHTFVRAEGHDQIVNGSGQTVTYYYTKQSNVHIHDWGEWVSGGNGTHSRICKTDNSHKETENCVGGKATCTHKAVCDVCHGEYGQAKSHDWGEWVSGGNGTHTRTCRTDNAHKETENCVGGNATCTHKPVCDVCHGEYGQAKSHDWGKATYTWTDTVCKAERVCKHDSTHIESETVTATGTVIKAATCKEKGKMKYTATFENTAFTKQEKEVDIDFAEHDFDTLIPEVPATTTEFGVKEHKDCKVCGKHFDKDGNEIKDLRIAKIGTHKVIVNGESEFYKEGESVTVTAEDKDGKVFKGWQDESGKIVSTEKSYKFTVSEGKTLTAVYEDKPSGGGEITPPAKKDGLSGGAIAGIVIGSVAVAGIGGFAVLWFAVKKKTFADLIAAIKALFTKKK